MALKSRILVACLALVSTINLLCPAWARGGYYVDRHGHRISEDRVRAIAAFNKAADYIDANEFDLAVANLRQAVHHDPSYEPAWYNLTNICVPAGKLGEAVDAGREFQRRFPRSDRLKRICVLVAAAEKELAQRRQAKEAGKMLGISGNEDFLPFVIRDGLRKWPEEKFPLKVYIHPAKGVREYRDSFKDLLLEAFADWQSASHGRARFEYVEEPGEAEIECRFIDNVHLLQSPAEGGETQSQEDAAGLKKATILLLTQRDGKAISPGRIKAIALHEIGHALGLGGHSDDSRDVMYFSVTIDSPSLSSRDINTLHRLYNEGPQLIASLRGRLKQAITETSANNDSQEDAHTPASEMPEIKARALDDAAEELYKERKLEQCEKVCRQLISLLEKDPLNNLSHLVTTLRNYANVLRLLNRTEEAQEVERKASRLEHEHPKKLAKVSR